MKKLMTLAVALIMGATLVQVADAGRAKFVASDDYLGPTAGAQPGDFQVCLWEMDFGCAAVNVVPGAYRYVSVEIEDDSGLPVAAKVYQLTNGGTEYAADSIPICDSTDEPIKLAGGVDFVGVWVYEGPCGVGPGAATQGEATFTFTRKP